MDADDQAPQVWTKSSRCVGGDCVEVMFTESEVRMRNSKGGPVLTFTRRQWGDFVGAVKRG